MKMELSLSGEELNVTLDNRDGELLYSLMTFIIDQDESKLTEEEIHLADTIRKELMSYCD